jgi:hypothetical protein
MNSFRVHRLPLFQAPDTPVDPASPPVVDPAVAAAAVAAAVADPPNPDPALDPAAPPVVDPAAPPADPAVTERQHGNKGRKPWYLDRISEETAARQAAEQREREALELARGLQQQQRQPGATPPVQPSLDETAIETRARQIAEQTINQDKIRTVITQGISAFPDWDDRAATLGAAGAASPAFVLDVYSVDPTNAHKILHALSDDPTKAAHLAKMDPRARTVELVKMSMAAQGTAPVPAAEVKPAIPPRTVSKAPAPPPPVDPGAAQAVDWRSDKASDADFSKGWEANQIERAKRRQR